MKRVGDFLRTCRTRATARPRERKVGWTMTREMVRMWRLMKRALAAGEKRERCRAWSRAAQARVG